MKAGCKMIRIKDRGVRYMKKGKFVKKARCV